LAVKQTTLYYMYSVSWECDSAGSCPIEPPAPRGGYFEGIFTEDGDSLAVRDDLDTVSFHSVTDSAFVFLVNGTAFPMRRN